MAQQIYIIEEKLTHEGQDFLLIGYVVLEDGEAKFTVHFELRERDAIYDGPFMSVDLNYSIDNPLVEGGVVIGAVTAYASCLAYAGFKFGIKAVKRCYEESRKNNPNADAWQRAREIADCLSKQGHGAKSAIADALLDCIPFKKLFNDDDP